MAERTPLPPPLPTSSWAGPAALPLHGLSPATLPLCGRVMGEAGALDVSQWKQPPPPRFLVSALSSLPSTQPPERACRGGPGVSHGVSRPLRGSLLIENRVRLHAGDPAKPLLFTPRHHLSAFPLTQHMLITLSGFPSPEGPCTLSPHNRRL